MSENEEADLYSVLGATSCDTVQHIKHKYQQLVLQYHPDRFRGDSTSEAESALKKFLEIDAAWRILKDQESRRQYDLKLRAQGLTQDWPVDSTVCLEDMSWDGDSGVYAYSCRCGGAFAVSEEELKKPDEEEEEEDGGLVVCCDTCSLSVFVTAQKKPQHSRLSRGSAEDARAERAPRQLTLPRGSRCRTSSVPGVSGGSEDNSQHQQQPAQLHGAV